MNSDLRYYGNPMNWESTKGDLISREALKKAIKEDLAEGDNSVNLEYCNAMETALDIIDNAPTVEPFERIGAICNENCGYRPQGECKDCKHFKESLCENSPNGWCSIRRATQEGDLETQVPKDYYCSWFEKGGVE